MVQQVQDWVFNIMSLLISGKVDKSQVGTVSPSKSYLHLHSKNIIESYHPAHNHLIVAFNIQRPSTVTALHQTPKAKYERLYQVVTT